MNEEILGVIQNNHRLLVQFLNRLNNKQIRLYLRGKATLCYCKFKEVCIRGQVSFKKATRLNMINWAIWFVMPAQAGICNKHVDL
jgi:hypothetical protein